MADDQNLLLPVYVVVGDDLLKRDRVIKRLHMRLEEFGDLAFNSDSFDAADADVEEILTACRTAPFASEKRLVVINNSSKFRKDQASAVAGYIEDPVDSTVLLIIADTMPPKAPILAAAKSIDAKAVIDCSSPKARDLPYQVRKMASVHGLNLDDAGARRLISLVGESTVHLDEELKKLSLAFSEGARPASVGSEQIEEMVAHVNEYKPWEFVDAFSERDIASCTHMLYHMPSVSAVYLLGLCVSRLRDLVGVKSALAEGGDVKSKVVENLRLPSNRRFLADIRMRQSRNFRISELIDAISSSMEAERRMKSGSDPDIAFQKWAFGVIGKTE